MNVDEAKASIVPVPFDIPLSYLPQWDTTEYKRDDNYLSVSEITICLAHNLCVKFCKFFNKTMPK